MTKPTQARIEAIRGAVARGWCHDANRQKEMDSDLAEAIVQEIAALTAAASLDPGEPRRLDDGNQGSPVQVGALTAAAEADAEERHEAQVNRYVTLGEAMRRQTIERCAQVAENHHWDGRHAIAAAIRALKDDKIHE